MDADLPSPAKMDVRHNKTFAHYFMTLVGAPNTQKFRELPTSQRQSLHFYYLWIKWHFISTLYRQHSIPHQLVRDPPRLRFWLRVLNPITPFFGGLKLVESNTRYTLFCNLIAIGRGAFWVLPSIALGRHILHSHPNGSQISDYLESDGYFIGHMIVPQKYDAKYQERYRQVRYEWYLTRGLAIPKEYMPKTQGQGGAQTGEGAQDAVGVKGGNEGSGEGKKVFEPKIAMRGGGGGDGRARMIKSTFLVEEETRESGKGMIREEKEKEDAGSWMRWFRGK